MSDGTRILVLRPGSAAITAVEAEPSATPPSTHLVSVRVAPNPVVGSATAVFEVRAEPLPGVASDALPAPLLGHGRYIHGSDPWNGRDGAGRAVASERYWVRTPRPVYPPEFETISFLLLR